MNSNKQSVKRNSTSNNSKRVSLDKLVQVSVQSDGKDDH